MEVIILYKKIEKKSGLLIILNIITEKFLSSLRKVLLDEGMVTNILTVKMGLCTVKMQEHYLLFHAIFSTINTAKL